MTRDLVEFFKNICKCNAKNKSNTNSYCLKSTFRFHIQHKLVIDLQVIYWIKQYHDKNIYHKQLITYSICNGSYVLIQEESMYNIIKNSHFSRSVPILSA
jgi:hypothetical protein